MSLPMIQDSWIYVGIDLLFLNSIMKSKPKNAIFKT